MLTCVFGTYKGFFHLGDEKVRGGKYHGRCGLAIVRTSGHFISKPMTRAIPNLILRMKQFMPEADKVVFYIGENADDEGYLLKVLDAFPSDKLILVMCTCVSDEFPKQRNVRVIRSECGGYETMGYLFTNFLETGKVELLPSQQKDNK